MANLTVTAANVAIGGDTARVRAVTVGEAVTQGEPVYFNPSDSKYYLAEAGDVVAKSVATAIVLTPAAADGRAVVATEGLVNVGATLSAGEIYVVSATAGAIAPIADLTTGDFVTILGVATSTSLIDLRITASQAATA